MRFFNKKNMNPEVIENEWTEKEYMEKRYQWLESVVATDEIHPSYKWTVVALLRDMNKRLMELEK